MIPSAESSAVTLNDDEAAAKKQRELKRFLQICQKQVAAIKVPLGNECNMTDQHEAIQTAVGLLAQLKEFPMSYLAVSEPGCLQHEALEWVKRTLRHSHPRVRKAAQQLGVHWLEKVQTEYHELSDRQIQHEKDILSQQHKAKRASREPGTSNQKKVTARKLINPQNPKQEVTLSQENSSSSLYPRPTSSASQRTLALQHSQTHSNVLLPTNHSMPGFALGDGRKVTTGTQSQCPSPYNLSPVPTPQSSQTSLPYFPMPPGSKPGSQPKKLVPSNQASRSLSTRTFRPHTSEGFTSAAKQQQQQLDPHPPEDTRTVSVSCQAAPTQYQRFFFPKTFQNSRANFARPIFKYYDIMNPAQVGVSDAPAQPPGLQHVPDHIQNDWFRLYYCDDIKFPRKDVLTELPEGVEAHLAVPAINHDANYWAEDNYHNAQELAEFVRWVASVKARSYVDDEPLGSLRVGLLKLLSDQLKTQSFNAAQLYRMKEQAIIHQMQERMSLYAAQMRTELDKIMKDEGAKTQRVVGITQIMEDAQQKIMDAWHQQQTMTEKEVVLSPQNQQEIKATLMDVLLKGQLDVVQLDSLNQKADIIITDMSDDIKALNAEKALLESTQQKVYGVVGAMLLEVEREQGPQACGCLMLHLPEPDLNATLATLPTKATGERLRQWLTLAQRGGSLTPSENAAILLELCSEDAGRVLARMNPGDAAPALQLLELAMQAEILSSIEAAAAAAVLCAMEPKKAVAALQTMDEQARAAALLAMDPAQAAKLLAMMDDPAALGAMMRMAPDKAADILRGMKPERAAELISQMADHDAAMILARLPPQALNLIASKLAPDKLGDLLESLERAGALAVLAELEPSVAARALLAMTPSRMHHLLQDMPPANAAAILKTMDLDEAAALLDELDRAAAKLILDALGAVDAAKFLDRMPRETVGWYLLQADAKYVAAVKEHMDPNRAAKAFVNLKVLQAVNILKHMRAKSTAGIMGQMPASKASVLLGEAAQQDPHHVARVLQASDPHHSAAMLEHLDKNVAAEAIAHMEPKKTSWVLKEMGSTLLSSILGVLTLKHPNEVTNIMKSMDVDSASDLLSKVGPEVSGDVVANLETSFANDIITTMEPGPAALGMQSCVLAKKKRGSAKLMLDDMDDDHAAALVLEMDDNGAALTLSSVMDSDKAASCLGKMENGKAAKFLDAIDDPSSVSRLIITMGHEDAAKKVNQMDVGQLCKALLSGPVLKAAELMGEMEAGKASEVVLALCPLDSDFSRSMLGIMDPFMSATVILTIAPQQAILPLSTMSPKKAAEMMVHMDHEKTKDFLEAVSAENPDVARRIIAHMTQEHRAKVLELMDPEIAAMLLERLDEVELEATLSLMALQISKFIAKLVRARKKASECKRWESDSLLEDSDDPFALRNKLRENKQLAGLMEVVTEADALWSKGVEGINETRKKVQICRDSVKGLNSEQIKEGLVELAVRVDDCLTVTRQSGDSLLHAVNCNLKVLDMYTAAAGGGSYLAGLFSPAVLGMVTTLEQHHTITGTALQHLRDRYGVECMVTEIGYDVTQDIDGDGQDDDDTYEDNVFIVRNKTQEFPEDSEVGEFIPPGSQAHQNHVAAADQNQQISFKVLEHCHEVYPIYLPEDCPLRKQNHYGTLAVCGEEAQLMQAQGESQLLASSLVALTVAMKRGVYEQMLAVGEIILEEEIDDSVLNQQKLQLEKILATKQMAQMMQEMRRYKKAPAAVVGVITAIVLLVNEDLRETLLDYFPDGGELPKAEHALNQLWGVVRLELNDMPGPQGVAIIHNMSRFFVQEEHAVDPPPDYVQLYKDLMAGTSSAALKRASSIATVLFDWLSIISKMIESEERKLRSSRR